MSGIAFENVRMEQTANTRSTEAEADWEELGWQSLGDGQLTIQNELLIFNIGGRVTKSLGNIVKLENSDSSSDNAVVHGKGDGFMVNPLRFTFRNVQDAIRFKTLAKEAIRRFPEDDEAPMIDVAERMQRVADIQKHYAAESAARKSRGMDAWEKALVYDGVSLTGPKQGLPGEDNHLGEGAVVLLDQEGRKNVYELHFIDTQDDELPDALRKASKYTIGRGMLPKAKKDGVDLGPLGWAISLDQKKFPAVLHTLNFDDRIIIDEFKRDYKVRAKFMESCGHITEKDRDLLDTDERHRREIKDIRSKSLLSRLVRLMQVLLLLLVVFMVARGALHYSQNNKQAPKHYLNLVLKDVGNLGTLIRHAGDQGAYKFCEVAGYSKPRQR